MRARTEALKALDARLGQALDVADRQLGQANGSLATVAAAAPPAQRTLERIAEVEIGTDCEASPRCWQNTAYDVSAASQAVARELPRFVASMDRVAVSADKATGHIAGMAEHAHAYTSRLLAPSPWYKQTLKYQVPAPWSGDTGQGKDALTPWSATEGTRRKPQNREWRR